MKVTKGSSHRTETVERPVYVTKDVEHVVAVPRPVVNEFDVVVDMPKPVVREVEQVVEIPVPAVKEVDVTVDMPKPVVVERKEVVEKPVFSVFEKKYSGAIVWAVVVLQVVDLVWSHWGDIVKCLQ